MGFDQRGASIFCVTRNETGHWDVTEVGFDKPLSSFDSAQDAQMYARDGTEQYRAPPRCRRARSSTSRSP
jgi:hypothetical protein